MKLTVSGTASEPVEYPPEVLSSVRKKLIESVQANADSFDAELVQRLLNEDPLLNRYLRRRNGDIETGFNFIKSALEWRKKLAISELNEHSFPSEFYQVGGIYLYKEDVHGNVVLHIRIRLFQKVEGILELLKKFSIYLMYQADELAAAKGPNYGWVLLFDCSEAGIANADIDMANFVSSTLRNYFPSGQKYVLVYKLPWLLNAVKTFIFAMLPAYVKRKIKFCDAKSLTDLIAAENLPDYMGGPGGPEQYRLHPKNTLTTREMVKKGLLSMSDEQLVKVYQYFDKLKALLYPQVE